MPKKKKIIVKKHVLMPAHIKLSEKEKKLVLEKFHITINDLPKISKNDAALARISVKAGDVIKILRQNPIAGEVEYYRVVVNE